MLLLLLLPSPPPPPLASCCMPPPSLCGVARGAGSSSSIFCVVAFAFFSFEWVLLPLVLWEVLRSSSPFVGGTALVGPTFQFFVGEELPLFRGAAYSSLLFGGRLLWVLLLPTPPPFLVLSASSSSFGWRYVLVSRVVLSSFTTFGVVLLSPSLFCRWCCSSLLLLLSFCVVLSASFTFGWCCFVDWLVDRLGDEPLLKVEDVRKAERRASGVVGSWVVVSSSSIGIMCHVAWVFGLVFVFDICDGTPFWGSAASPSLFWLVLLVAPLPLRVLLPPPLSGAVSLVGFWVALGTNQFGRSRTLGNPNPESLGLLFLLSPLGRCCFGWCCCPILVWCGAASPILLLLLLHDNLVGAGSPRSFAFLAYETEVRLVSAEARTKNKHVLSATESYTTLARLKSAGERCPQPQTTDGHVCASVRVHPGTNVGRQGSGWTPYRSTTSDADSSVCLTSFTVLTSSPW